MDGASKIRKAYESILGSDFEQAIDWFEEAVAEEPDNPEYHYKLSVTYARSHKLRKALDHAQLAARLNPTQEQYALHLHNLLALEHIHHAEQLLQDDRHQAYLPAALLNKAIRLDPLAVDAYVLLAMAKAKLGEFDEAVRSLREALKLDPGRTTAIVLLDEYTQRLREQLRSHNAIIDEGKD